MSSYRKEVKKITGKAMSKAKTLRVIKKGDNKNVNTEEVGSLIDAIAKGKLDIGEKRLFKLAKYQEKKETGLAKQENRQETLGIAYENGIVPSASIINASANAVREVGGAVMTGVTGLPLTGGGTTYEQIIRSEGQGGQLLQGGSFIVPVGIGLVLLLIFLRG